MKTQIIILTLLIFQTSFGQNNLSELKSFSTKIKNVEDLSNIETFKFDSLSIVTTFKEIERKIDFGYSHLRILIMPSSGWELKLNLISKNGKIQIFWVSEFDSSKEKHLNQFAEIKTPDFLKNYISKHNDFYNSKLSKSDFETQFLAEYVVGFGCGKVGLDISKESKKMLHLVDKKKTKKLEKYLTSFSPELQTLGTIGLLKIGKLNSEQKRIIKHLKQRESIILSCSGCLYGMEESYNERIENFE